MDPIRISALEASLNNPLDPYEITLIADAASVGVTDKIKSTNRKIDWTADALERTANTMKGMPINLMFNEDGSTNNHSRVVVGNVTNSVFDKTRNKLVATGTLWKHYFPETMDKLTAMHAAGKAQVSMEFMPTSMESIDDETDRPLDGRFIGLSIVDDGADHGNFIQLLASAERESEVMNKSTSAQFAATVGSFEWIGEKFVDLLASKTTDDKPINVVATYPDRIIYAQSDGFYQVGYSIESNNIKFGDTIEVEAGFTPLTSSAPDIAPIKPVTPTKEAAKPMAEIDDKELQELRASASEKDKLTELVKELQAEKSETDTKLADAEKKVTEADEEREARKLDELAASRMEEVEKIKKYDDTELRKNDLETFKTLNDNAFDLVKRTMLAASTAGTGGVSDEGKAPRSPQDEDGEADAILESEDFKKLLASMSKEDK